MVSSKLEAHISLKAEYSLGILVDMAERRTLSKYRPRNTLLIKAWFYNGRNFLRREYPLYGYDSLIADVGGYLGLLLGHSILSIVCYLTGRFNSGQ